MKYVVCALLIFFGTKTSISKPGFAIRVVNSYPMNGAQNVHPLAGIGVTYSLALRKSSLSDDSISVSGSFGTKYSGTLKLSSNGRTVIFTPSTPFMLGETIYVRFGAFQTISEAVTPSYSLTYTIREKFAPPATSFHSDDPVLENQLHKNLHYNKAHFSGTGGMLQPENLPLMNIIDNDDPSDGNMYIANYKYVTSQTNTYRMILDKYGSIFNAQGGGPDYYNDFKPNPDGTYSYFDELEGSFSILDSNLAIIDTLRSTYGYVTDAHEIRVTSEGNHYIIAADEEFIDMTQYVQGGWTAATVLVPVIEEFDRDKNLIFEWRSIDHFTVTDATHEDLLLNYIDFCHINAIEFDADSNLLISCRHMDEITKIDRQTGEIIWRWGGKNNQFSLAGDTLPFSHQHAIRRTDSGTYTMFDNGNFHQSNAAYSRAVEYQLDQTNMIATRIWEFRHKPDVISLAMGYVQRLPNGNTFIGWGECDNLSITEVTPDNETVYEMGMTDGNYSYRAYKYDSNYVHQAKSTVTNSSGPVLNTSLVCMPNPITDKAQIQFSIAEHSDLRIALYDQLGREAVHIYTGDLASGAHSFLVNSGDLAAGVYHIKVMGSNGLSLDKQVVILR